MSLVKSFFQTEITEAKRNDIIRTGEFVDMSGRPFTITEDDLKAMVNNFSKNPLRRERRGRPVAPVNYGHDAGGKAAGWLSNPKVEKRDDGHFYLTADIEWVGQGKEAVQEGEYSFISAEIYFNYEDEDEVSFDVILSGAGLTNIPAVKGMRALAAQSYENETKGVQKMPMQEVIDMVKTLSPDEMMQVAQIIKDTLGDEFDLMGKKEMEDKAEKMAEAKMSEYKRSQSSEIARLQESLEQLKEENAKVKKEKEFEALFSQGKVVEAQRAAFMTGDMAEFARNAVHVNLQAAGHGSDVDASADYTKVEKCMSRAVSDFKAGKGKSISALFEQYKKEEGVTLADERKYDAVHAKN